MKRRTRMVCGAVGGVGLLLSAAACTASDDVGTAGGDVPATGGAVGSTPGTDARAPETVPAVASTGCGIDAESPATGAVTQETITSGAETREYRQLVPSSYSASTPLPLVLDYHGLLEGAAMHAESDQWEAFGEANDIIVVTPQGLGPVVHWTVTNDAANNDVVFATDLLDHLESSLCIDTARVYANGLSNGGMMSSVLGCQMSDRIAAIGNVSGMMAPEDCAPSRPMPVMVFWGSLDPLLKYDGGFAEGAPAGAGASGGFAPVETMVGHWADLDGCGTEPELNQYAEHVEERVYAGCADGSAVVLYTITNGGHTWPGSEMYQNMASNSAPADGSADDRGVTTDEIDATAVLWEFFVAHPLAG